MAHSSACQAYTAKIEALSAEWRAKWPNACTTCHGSGGEWSYSGGSYWGEQPSADFEACDFCVLSEEPCCARCGHKDAEFKVDMAQCSKCYWNWDFPPGEQERQDSDPILKLYGCDPILKIYGCDCAYQGDENE